MLSLKAATLVLIAFLGTLMLSGCAFGGGGDDVEEEPTPLFDFFQILDPDTLEPDTPTPRPNVGQRTPVLRPTPTPVAQNMDDARKLVWSYLGQCFSFDPGQLDANKVRGDWFVKASGEVSPIEYGLWKVDAVTGSLEPQDPLGRAVKAYVESQCNSEKLPAPFVPTAIPTPTTAPTATPVPTPVAQKGEQARNLVWAYLGTCADLFVAQLEPFQVKDDWFVQTSINSPVQYGLWKVDSASGTIDPHDLLAGRWDTVEQSECDQDVFETLLPPTPTPTLTPIPTPTPVPTPTPTPTPRPTSTPKPTATPKPTSTPTPIPPTPTPVPLVTKAEGAVRSVWGHLVPCFRFLRTGDLQAEWDPSQGVWVVITGASSSQDFGVWNVGRVDGTVAPANFVARNREKTVKSGNC